MRRIIADYANRMIKIQWVRFHVSMGLISISWLRLEGNVASTTDRNAVHLILLIAYLKAIKPADRVLTISASMFHVMIIMIKKVDQLHLA